MSDTDNKDQQIQDMLLEIQTLKDQIREFSEFDVEIDTDKDKQIEALKEQMERMAKRNQEMLAEITRLNTEITRLNDTIQRTESDPRRHIVADPPWRTITSPYTGDNSYSYNGDPNDFTIRTTWIGQNATTNATMNEETEQDYTAYLKQLQESIDKNNSNKKKQVEMWRSQIAGYADHLNHGFKKKDKK